MKVSFLVTLVRVLNPFVSCRYMGRWGGFFCVVALGLFLVSIPARADNPELEKNQDNGGALQRVLVINSYHPGFPWSDRIMEGISSVFASSSRVHDIEVWTEYLDTKRLSDLRHFNDVQRLFARKFQGNSFDAVIVSDNNALDFILPRRQALFPGVPVIFCGINGFMPDLFKGQENLTGVVEDVNFKGTINLALRLHSSTNKIIVITPDNATGRANNEIVKDLAGDYGSQATFEFWHGLPLEEVEEKITETGEPAILLPIGVLKTRSGKVISPDHVVEYLRGISPYPIYSIWDYLVGKGIVGGLITSGFLQGQTAAKLALEVLNGADISTLPVIIQSPNRYMFDYAELARFNIPESGLPQGSEIINVPPGLLEEHLGFVLVVSAGILILSGYILVLLVSRHRQKQSELALRKSEERLHNIIEGSIQAIVIHRDGKIVFANAALANIFGYENKESLIGISFLDLCNPEQRQRISGDIKEWMGGEGAMPNLYEFEGLAKDGAPLWLIHSARRVEWEGAPGIQSSLVDVSKLRETEKALQHVQKLDVLGQLTGGVAHDFNNLLMIIMGYAETLGMEGKNKYVDGIIQAVTRGSDLTSQLLGFARKQALVPKTILPDQFLEDIREMLSRTLGENIEITVKNEQDIWPCYVDTAQLESAIVNLAVNARDAMPDGGHLSLETRNISLDSGYTSIFDIEPGHYVCISVTDSGAGMSPQIREKVLDPFFTTKEKGKGTGLGLSMVYGFIRQSGGHMNIYSEEGHGTTINIYLPVQSEDSAEKSAEVAADGPISLKAAMPDSVPDSSPDARVKTASLSILVVEDQGDVRETVVWMLRNLGHEVSEAQTVDQAKSILADSNKFDLLLTDVIIPGSGGGGEGLAAFCAEKYPDLTIIFMSGYTDNALFESGRLREGVLLLNKPFRKNELAEKIDQAMGA